MNRRIIFHVTIQINESCLQEPQQSIAILFSIMFQPCLGVRIVNAHRALKYFRFAIDDGITPVRLLKCRPLSVIKTVIKVSHQEIWKRSKIQKNWSAILKKWCCTNYCIANSIWWLGLQATQLGQFCELKTDHTTQARSWQVAAHNKENQVHI